MKIAVLPYYPSFPNKYIDRMVETIRIAYPDTEITAFPRTKKILSLKGYDYVWLNWFENLPKKSKFMILFIRGCIIFFLKLMGIKIISTFHNRLPHEYTNSLLDRTMFYLTFRYSNKIIILSSDSRHILEKKYGKSILRKVVLIPHPTYDCKPKVSKDESNNFRILFFGQLRPYKNIDIILELAKTHKDVHFTIAGNPYNETYVKDIKKLIDSLSNVTLIPHFLSSEEIDELIDLHSVLLLPYNIQSSLNSGVAIYAICKRINMIIPSIGTINQLIHKDQVFTYTYDSKEYHLIQLNKMIEIVQNEFENNHEKFEKRIEILFNEVTSNQNPKALSKKIRQLFS